MAKYALSFGFVTGCSAAPKENHNTRVYCNTRVLNVRCYPCVPQVGQAQRPYPAGMTLPLEDDHRPPYVQVAEYLRRQIQSGELSPGDKVPSSRELQEQFGLASATIQNAFRLLKNEGLIYSVQGRGSFIRRPAPEPETPETEQEPGEAPNTSTSLSPADSMRYHQLTAEVASLRKDVSDMQDHMLGILKLMQELKDQIDGEDA